MKQILLVEGRDDQHVIYALCQKFQLSKTFDVKDTDGVDNLLKQLPVQLKSTGLRTIGIIVDADSGINHRWKQIRSILRDRLPNIPTSVPKEGLVFEENSIRVGVWLMPNNELNGMLENFIQFLVPSDDELILEVENHLNQVEGKKLNKYRSIHKDKAKIHAWLALQEDPGTPLGLSITKKYLNPNVKECKVLVDWLKFVFQ